MIVKYITLREEKNKKIRGYIDTYTEYWQHLAKQYYIFGIKIYTKIYHSEQIPSAIIFQNDILGSTDWISPNKEIINNHIKLWKSN